jgi:ATP-dependent exoDNAse (exonuclease V) beta subunit
MINILKASAGTGKTYRLSLEYVAALLRGEDFKRIVVMTFTRKATAEIRERIIEHIENILESQAKSEVWTNLKEIYPDLEFNIVGLNKVYEEMLKNKDQIKVSTIDSFTNNIFKEAIAPYLNIYEYEMIDDDANAELIEEVFKRLLDNEEDFALMEEFLMENVERDIARYIELLNKILQNRWKFLLFDHDGSQKKPVANVIHQFKECISILQEIAAVKDKDFSPKYFKKDFRDCFDLAEAEMAEWITENCNQIMNNTFWNGHKTRGKAVKELKTTLELEYERVKEGLARLIYNQKLLPYQEQIFKFSQKVFEIYDQIKFWEKQFTHADISNYTYQYLYDQQLNLLDNDEMSSYFFDLLGTEINTLLIDEFQDTSILQWRILEPLINKCENLAVVGDQKQSIYSWRGGEKELFANLENILVGKRESLKISYRSEKEIINFVNRFFIEIDRIREDWDYDNVDFLAENNKGYVEVLLGGSSAVINTETKSFARKSEEIRQQIEDLNEKIVVDLKSKIAETIKDKVDNYNNVGILARTNRDIKEIAAKLAEKDIPYILESQDSLIDHQAIKPLYFLLRYLAYNDYFQLIKFLRSDLIAISEVTLKYLLNHDDQIKEYMINVDLDLQRDIDLELLELEEVLSLIRELKDFDFNFLSTYIIENFGLIEEYQDTPNALKNIYYFMERMKEFNHLDDFMNYLEENKDNEELKQVGVQDNNAVKLMTVHKAKGLSFETEFFYWNIKSGRGSRGQNLEFYLDFDDKFEEVRDYLLTDSKYNKLLEYMDLDFYQEQERKAFVEEINNIYVAMTRPERNLFLYIDAPCQFKKKWNTKEWSTKDYEIYEETILAGIELDSLKTLVEGKSIGEFRENEVEEEESRVNIKDLREYFNLAEIPKMRVKEINDTKDFKMNLDKEIKRMEGLAVHYYLEYIKNATREEQEFAQKMTLAKYGNILGPKKMEDLFERIEEFLEREQEYFADRWEVFTEYELRDAKKRHRIDRLLLDNESKEIVILDYKTGEIREEAQLQRYKRIIAEKLESEYEIRTDFLEI